MPLTRSKQDYLKALYALAADGEAVGTSDLAGRLGVSAPSVTGMLGRLRRERLVTWAPRAGARLTRSGRREAIEIVRRHRIVETFLAQVLKLDRASVHEHAEVLEHAIADRVLDAMDRLIGHPREDPHGHPIPDRRGRVRPRTLMPIANLLAGERAVVREIGDHDRRRVAHWTGRGLVPGARVRMRSVRPLEGLFELELAGGRWVTSATGLDGVQVERAARRTNGRR